MHKRIVFDDGSELLELFLSRAETISALDQGSGKTGKSTL